MLLARLKPWGVSPVSKTAFVTTCKDNIYRVLGLFGLWPLFNRMDQLQAALATSSCETCRHLKAYLHLGGSNLAHSHEGPWCQQRDLKERFRRGRMLQVAWLWFLKEVIRNSMPQQSCQLLHGNSGLVRKLLKGYSWVEWDKGLDVVMEDRPETDRGSKLMRSVLYQPVTQACTHWFGDDRLYRTLVEPVQLV